MTLPPALEPLSAFPQFITYRLVPSLNNPAKLDKLPCVWSTGEVTGKAAGVGRGGAMNPEAWGFEDQAASGASLADRGFGSGTGFVLTDTDPFWFLDIDNCLSPDGQWTPLAIELCSRLAGAAVEVSQSGRGLHIIGSGRVPDHRCKNIPLGLELYHADRFVALTGRQTHGSADADLSDALAAVVADYFTPQAGGRGALTDWTSAPCEEWNGPIDDDELIDRALVTNSAAARVGDKATFRQLWLGDDVALAKHFPSDQPGKVYDASSADASLAMRLAYWTGRDCERIDTLMRRSGLYREKFERSDYMQRTIQRAAGECERVCADTAPMALPEPPPYVTGLLSTPAPAAPPPPPADDYIVPALDNQASLDKQSHLAIEYWLTAAGHTLQYDEFADVILLDGRPIDDDRMLRVWFDTRALSGVKFGKELFFDALRNLAARRRFHPVRDYLATVQTAWDGVSRIDSWLTRFLGVADDGEGYVQAVGALFLTAAVRRIREPGAKFDEMLVLEGPQGLEKSSALAALMPTYRWFTDEIEVGMPSKDLLEQTGGKWIVEAPELKGLAGRGVDHMKAFLARRFDKARMAYDRYPVERGRQWVVAATNNDSRYLSDPTGNRRIWPVVCTSVDLAGLVEVRDQLWAEAAVREAAGVSIRMPRNLWAVAGEHQAERLVHNSLQDDIQELLGNMSGRVKIRDIGMALGMDARDRDRFSRKTADAMKLEGWEAQRLYIKGERSRWFVKGDSNRLVILTADRKSLEYSPPELWIVQ